MVTTEVTPMTKLERLSLEVSQEFAPRMLEIAMLPSVEMPSAVAAFVRDQQAEVQKRFQSWQAASTDYAAGFEKDNLESATAYIQGLADKVDKNLFEQMGSLALICYPKSEGGWQVTFKLNKVIQVKQKASASPKPASANGSEPTVSTGRKGEPVTVSKDGQTQTFASMSAALKEVLKDTQSTSRKNGIQKFQTAGYTVS